MMEARLAKPEEAQVAVDWLVSTPENMFDPEVLGYPSTVTFAVDGPNETPDLFMPIQIAVFMESLGKRPGIRKRDMAYALISMIAEVHNFALGANLKEIYFYCKERTVSAQAPKFGFEVICEDKERGITLFRMKVKHENHES
jgi:hypothetical protein